MDPEESKRALTGGKVHAVQTNRGWSLRMMAEMLMFFQRRFMGMRLLLMHANDAFFVTTDCPVAVHDPATMPLLPQGFQSLEMRFRLQISDDSRTWIFLVLCETENQTSEITQNGTE
jgi:hypothetical protein